MPDKNSLIRQNQTMRERLIVSLDVADGKTARALVKSIGDAGVFYKIGYQLLLADGLNLVKELVDSGKKVFLDIKLLDIDNTVARATENAIRLGVSMLSLHAYPKVMQAACSVAEGSPLCLLGVTVLTSMDNADLRQAGYEYTAEALVLKRAKQAKQAGLGGLVASAAEAQALRRIIGPDMALVTPGIRMLDDEKGDQKRVMTPSRAIAAGASHLVVGRPIVQAADPKSALQMILADMENA